MLGERDLSAALDDMRARSHGLARAAWIDGRLCCAYGVCTRTVLGAEGHPWMLATEAAEAEPGIIARRSRTELLAVIPPHVTRLWNLVHEENRLAIRWLRWLRFRFEDRAIDHGGLRWRLFHAET